MEAFSQLLADAQDNPKNLQPTTQHDETPQDDSLSAQDLQEFERRAFLTDVPTKEFFFFDFLI